MRECNNEWKETIRTGGQHHHLHRPCVPAPAPVSSIIQFSDEHIVSFSNPPGNFQDDTPFIDAAGLLNSAFFSHGKGRVVIFGEAAMFSAQFAGPQKFKTGMNAPSAKYNAQLLLNIIHYLDGLL